MKKTLRLGLLCAAGVLTAQNVYAQSSVTLYGVLDVGIRMDTHQSASGGKLYTMGNGGPMSSNRWGLLGKEDLGAGMHAFFRLENGFTPNTGAFQNATPSGGVREFGRTALVGIGSNEYGDISLGRQYALVHEMVGAHDVLGLSNYAQTYAFQAAGLTGGGGRLDNSVRYTSPNIAGIVLTTSFTLGNTSGDFHRYTSPAVSLSYGKGPLTVGATYQIVNDIGGLTPASTQYGSSYFGVVMPDSDQKLFTVGATYKVGKATLYGSYIYSHVYPADYRNDSFSVAALYAFTSDITMRLPVYIDFLHHASTSGTRITTGPIFDYAFSKATDVYIGVDYTHLTGAWTTLASSSTFTIPLYGANTLLEAFVGLRHSF